MSSLFQELKRRNVFRVAIAYLVLAWVVLQITDLVAPALHLPDWTMSMVIFLGFVGFPFALLFAWAFELTPEGLKRSEDVELEESITGHTAGKLTQGTMALLVLAIVILVLDRQLGLSERWQPASESTTEPVVVETVPEEKSEATEQPVQAVEDDEPESIAVLPFVNMSDDPSQEYFSDGISEELLNGLAKIRELRVAARTSSFAFKGKNQDITQIGEALKVATVLEGSVRKSGQRVRITAQLINVEDGYHLWSETYDRDLVDIFAVQDEISAAIVDALKVHLTDEQSTAPRQKVDLQAYNFVLQARHNVRLRTKDALELAVLQYEQALDIDKNYAQAWAGMAIAYSLLRESQYGDIPDDESYRIAQGHLDTAFSIDPDLFEAHAGQALVYLEREDPERGLVSIERALAINPSEGVLYLWQSFLFDLQGRYTDATRAIEKAYEVDPLHPSIQIVWADRLVTQGRYAEVRGLVTPGTRQYYAVEWEIAFDEGRWADMYRVASEAYEKLPSAGSEFSRVLGLTMVAGLHEIERGLTFTSLHHTQVFSADLDPQPVVEEMLDDQAMNLPPADREVLVVALERLGRCEDVVQILEPLGLEAMAEPPLRNGGHSPGSFVFPLSWCLTQTGELDRGRVLAERMLGTINRAIEEGQQRSRQLTDMARLTVISGDEEGALELLREAVDRDQALYRDFDNVQFSSLVENAEFQAMRAEVLVKLNRERADLGWDPVRD